MDQVSERANYRYQAKLSLSYVGPSFNDWTLVDFLRYSEVIDDGKDTYGSDHEGAVIHG